MLKRGDCAHRELGQKMLSRFFTNLACEPGFFNISYGYQVRGSRMQRQGRSVVCSMGVNGVDDNSAEDAKDQTHVEDGSSKWNLRWRPRTASDGGRNNQCRKADQEHGHSPNLVDAISTAKPAN